MADESKTRDPVGDETPLSPQRKNSLEKHLAHRPDKAELVQKNILPDSTAAPGLQAHQKEVRVTNLLSFTLLSSLDYC